MPKDDDGGVCAMMLDGVTAGLLPLSTRAGEMRAGLVLMSTTASFLVACLLFLMMYFWTVNRQAHLKKTKGTAITFKRSQSCPVGGSVDNDDWLLLEEEEDTVTTTAEEEEASEELALGVGCSSSTRRWSKLKPQKSDLRRRRRWSSIYEIEIEFDEGDDEEEFQPPDQTKPSQALPTMLKEETPTKKSFMHIASNVKVLSYFGKEAVEEIAKYAEYVDIPIGQPLFERGKFDGSLLIVVSGRVRCLFHEYRFSSDDDYPQEQQGGEGEKGLLSISSGPGDMVTPLLGLLAALVRAYPKKVAGDNAQASDGSSLAIANGVSAVATAKNTRLIRVPPTCFAVLLEKFPANVHMATRTILSRVQRVTLQTLVKTLGLDKELITRSQWETPEEKKKRNASKEWQRLFSAFKDGKSSPDDMASVKRDGAVYLVEQLGIPPKDGDLLMEHASIVTLPAGKTLIQTALPHDAIYLLLNGKMEIGAVIRKHSWAQQPTSPPQLYFYRYQAVEPGSIIGRIASFTDANLFEIRSQKETNASCTLLKIPKAVFDTVIIRQPSAIIACLGLFLRLISPLVHLLNWNSDWMHVEASEAIAHRGDRCDSIFMVLNGRLRASYKTSPNSVESTEEYGRGKFIGEISGLTGSAWPSDIYAIRKSELVRVPIAVLLAVIQAYPSCGIHFARVIASQVQSKNNGDNNTSDQNSNELGIAGDEASTVSSVMPSYGLNLATIAVVPLASTNVGGFCDQLVSALNDIAPVKLMTKATAREHLGERTFRPDDAIHEVKMTRLLGDMEEKYRLVVYQADLKYTWWTQLAIKQADCILLLVSPHQVPRERQVERCLAWAHESMRVRIELVFVSPEESRNDEATDDQLDEWTEQREWITGSHLIRAPFVRYAEDFRRMCRRITGLSVGLALGGGGARGLAHLGVIRALMEAGVTVDMVGGTSQGAYIAALYAQDPDQPEAFVSSAREMANNMSSMMEKLYDLTLPMTSMFSGRRFNLGIQNSLGGTKRIQHLVLNFFCVSVDIRQRHQVVHTKGLLWKCVRASMSLAGYLPPLSEHGSLLVDGGYLNVVPADVMRNQMRARTVIAVDVSPETEREYFEYGDYLSGWWLLWNSWNPFVETVQVPSMGDISDALRWVSSEQHRKEIIHSTDLHLTPPVGEYGTLEYDKFDEIVETAYVYAKPIVDEWVERNSWLVSGQPQSRKERRYFNSIHEDSVTLSASSS